MKTSHKKKIIKRIYIYYNLYKKKLAEFIHYKHHLFSNFQSNNIKSGK